MTQFPRRARRAARGQLRRQGGHRRAPERRPAIRASAPVLTALLEDRLYFRNDGPAGLHRQVGRRGARRLRADRSAVARRTPGSAPPDELTKIGTNNRLRRCCGRPWRASRCRAPTRRCGWTRSRRCCARSTRRASALLRERIGVETDPGVQDGDRDRPGARRARRRRSAGAARGDRHAGAAALRPDVRNRLAALLEQVAGRQLRRKRRRGAARPRPRPCAASISCARVLLGHRDAVLRPEPRLGAGAGRDRPGDHVRRHGRHQHGARRADDARRLHHLRRAAGDARTHRAVDPGGDSGGVPGRRRWPAC